MIFTKEIITSRANLTVKWAVSLSDKKGRAASECFITEGVKLLSEALASQLPITHILVSEDKYRDILKIIDKYTDSDSFKNTVVTVFGKDAFSKISTEKSPEGVISVIKYLDIFKDMDIIYKEDFFLLPNERAIFLCSVRDPGNLGAVIRSAVAFGVDHIIVSADCADIYNPRTIRGAMASLFRVKVTRVGSPENFIDAAKANGRRVFAAELTENARSLDSVGINSKDIVIIGNEGHGIPKEVSAIVTSSVYIPISSKTESLNASVAAAIFMWEQNKNI